MLAEILLLILEIGWHYHNSDPEKVRVANSKIFLAGTDLSIFRDTVQILNLLVNLESGVVICHLKTLYIQIEFILRNVT